MPDTGAKCQIRAHFVLRYFLFSASQEHDIKPLGPIETMLRHCLYAHITQRYDTVCGHLLHVMKMDYQLLSYFHAIKVDFVVLQ